MLVKKINKAILEKEKVKILNLDTKPSQQVQEIIILNYKTKGWTILFKAFCFDCEKVMKSCNCPWDRMMMGAPTPIDKTFMSILIM